jgi:FMN phosphatase YigB (HAD superfamily)
VLVWGGLNTHISHAMRETDLQGARRAGLRAAWPYRDHRDWPGDLARPDAVIDELWQLLRVLRQQGH